MTNPAAVIVIVNLYYGIIKFNRDLSTDFVYISRQLFR